MKTASVILAHPYPKSFNHAIFSKVCQTLQSRQAKVFSHDLYAEKFDPLLTEEELGYDISSDPLVKAYAQELLESDLLFFVHPNWWGQPPAILKGYIDRIFRPPYAYDFFPDDNGGGLPVPKLTGKKAIVFNTANTSMERETEVFGDPLERIWKDCIFGFCGVKMSERRMFRIVSDSSEEKRLAWLEEVAAITEQALCL
jgi:putative NADPH-quinone reductase